MSDKDINDEDNLSLGEQLNHEMTGCPCGCDGIAQLHDDRSYGWWECPRCGNDSDEDLGKDCSRCKQARRDSISRGDLYVKELPLLPQLKLRIETDECIYEEYNEP